MEDNKFMLTLESMDIFSNSALELLNANKIVTIMDLIYALNTDQLMFIVNTVDDDILRKEIVKTTSILEAFVIYKNPEVDLSKITYEDLGTSAEDYGELYKLGIVMNDIVNLEELPKTFTKIINKYNVLSKLIRRNHIISLDKRKKMSDLLDRRELLTCELIKLNKEISDINGEIVKLHNEDGVPIDKVNVRNLKLVIKKTPKNNV